MPVLPGGTEGSGVSSVLEESESPSLSRASSDSSAPSESRAILNALAQLVEPLAEAMPGRVEVVVHDLSSLPDSIVAVGGDLTGRKPGDPATDYLLEAAAGDALGTQVGYGTVLDDGTQLVSTTVVVRNRDGVPTAALCINGDVEPWRKFQEFIQQAVPSLREQTGVAPPSTAPRESFARNVDDLATVIVARAIGEQGVPVELMHKEHKVAVVKAAKARGLFMLRDAVEMLAEELGVTRFTIYNYLSSIAKEEEEANDA